VNDRDFVGYVLLPVLWGLLVFMLALDLAR
jgi:hypothetical protein